MYWQKRGNWKDSEEGSSNTNRIGTSKIMKENLNKYKKKYKDTKEIKQFLSKIWEQKGYTE